MPDQNVSPKVSVRSFPHLLVCLLRSVWKIGEVQFSWHEKTTDCDVKANPSSCLGRAFGMPSDRSVC